MGLFRYAILDAYTREELRHEYQNSDAKGRIDLLQRLYKQQDRLPYELARMAVDDPHTEVRQWIARHGKALNYVDYDVVGEKKKQEDEIPSYDPYDRYNPYNLEGRLKNDPALLRRASGRHARDSSFLVGLCIIYPFAQGAATH